MQKLGYFFYENINLEYKLHESSEPISTIAFLSDYLFIAGGMNGIIQIHDFSAITAQNSLLNHTSPITAIGRNDNLVFITADSEGNIICWDGTNKRVINQININKYLGYSPTAVMYKKDALEKIHIKRITSISKYHQAYLIPNKIQMMPPYCWDYQTHDLNYVGGADQYPCGGTSIVVSKDGEYLVWTSGTAIIILSIQTGKIVRQIGKAEAYGVRGTREIFIPINNQMDFLFEGLHSGRINSIDLSPSMKYLITGSEDRSIRIWDFHGLLDFSHAKPIMIFNTQHPIDAVYFVGPEMWVAASYDSGIITSGDLEKTWEENRFNKENSPIGGIAVSPSLIRFAAWYKNGKILIWFLA